VQLSITSLQLGIVVGGRRFLKKNYLVGQIVKVR